MPWRLRKDRGGEAAVHQWPKFPRKSDVANMYMVPKVVHGEVIDYQIKGNPLGVLSTANNL